MSEGMFAVAPPAELHGLSLSFYTPDEIRQLSAVKVVNPVALDEFNNPTKGGLYDPLMGPLERFTNCVKCGLGQGMCPGHLGHIELAVPLYNPVLFPQLFLLLRALCFGCHRFKLIKYKVHYARIQLALFDRGLLLEAINTPPPKDKDALVAETKEEQEAQEESKRYAEPFEADKYMRKLDDYFTNCTVGVTKADVDAYIQEKNTHTQNERRLLVADFWRKALKPKRCENCKCISPPVKKDGPSKIFKKHLQEKYRRINEALGIRTDWAAPEAPFLPPDKKKKGKGKAAEEEAGLGDNGEDDDDEKSEEKSEESEGDDPMDTTDANDNGLGKRNLAQEESRKLEKTGIFMSTMEVKHLAERLWGKEEAILNAIFSSAQPSARGKSRTHYTMFFIEVLAVAPNRFRPVARRDGVLTENPTNVHLKNVLQNNLTLAELTDLEHIKKEKDGGRDLDTGRILATWIDMQNHVNTLYDSTKGDRDATPGIRQLMEKKQGLFRMHMMGKRVNYAARSVISPDPNIETSEIGVPLVFARVLTFPEPVTHHNLAQMRAAVQNGPDVHPGANFIQEPNGTMIDLAHTTPERRAALAAQLATPASSLTGLNNGPKVVFRHMVTGDHVLMNRQPTLHRPSLMGHRVRVLKKEKTLRMHYANCKGYNADFDGDEMNLHLPQDTLGRAEAMCIANTDNQYILPRDATPIRGLIQDHLSTGVLLTKRDQTFDRETYQQIVFVACNSLGRKVLLLPPAYLKPRRLWTGKQIVSTILLNVVGKERAGLNLEHDSQVSAREWPNEDEQAVVFSDGELLQGVLDKKAYGASPRGFVHAVYELYGPATAGQLLTTLGRMFTAFLQFRGFSCGVDDLLLHAESDNRRRDLLIKAVNDGKAAAEEWARQDPTSEKATTTAEALRIRLRRPGLTAHLDNKYRTALAPVANEIMQKCLAKPNKPFPWNNMAVMTLTGAKGSTVNMSQISCLLGITELEGKRVPTMVSGKTLPSFQPYEALPRAGGFIQDRFLTGLKPQEYFFHCMAGRDGLVDTAVKTARSGYLQRCLIKHLEGLRVHYDYTVRDADNSIVQFRFGEDALDPSRTAYLEQFKFLTKNKASVVERLKPEEALVEGVLNKKKADQYFEKLSPDQDTVISRLSPGKYLGAVSERYHESVEKALKDLRKPLPGAKYPLVKDEDEANLFVLLAKLNYLSSLSPPGDPVGVIAAQSVGEPSTQMTLNTFHFAGVGEKNVTLGVPRLTELLMMASTHPKTPDMRLSLAPGKTKADAQKVANKLTRLALTDILTGVQVSESIEKQKSGWSRVYALNIKFMSRADAKGKFGLGTDELKKAIKLSLLPRLDKAVSQQWKKMMKEGTEGIGTGQALNKLEKIGANPEEEGEGGGDDEGGGGERVSRKEMGEDKDGNSSESSDSEADAPEEGAVKDKGDDDDEVDEPENEGEAKAGEDMDAENTGEGAGAADKDEKPAKEEEEHDLSKFEVITRVKLSKKCEELDITLELPANGPRVFIVDLIERIGPTLIIRATRGIKEAVVLEDSKTKQPYISIDGVNFGAVWHYSDVVDMPSLRSNDIYQILKTYGVEAAHAAIVREITFVFDPYGIKVDKRHLTLMADYMTFEGGYKPLNRMGMEGNVSPFGRMTFETTMKFLVNSAATSEYDPMRNPSARIVAGRVIDTGTGSFELLQPLMDYGE